MFEITDTAKDEIRTYFTQNDPAPVRVFIANGCGGPMLALGLDEEREGDQVIAVEELTFVIDTELLEKAKPVVVDFAEQGFSLTSSLVFEDRGTGGCGSCCGC